MNTDKAIVLQGEAYSPTILDDPAGPWILDGLVHGLLSYPCPSVFIRG
jgi:hypothetical protein